jgi:hypothetical protein
MNICIWCKKESEEYSKEHIIPEALGCPEGFELTAGEVCRRCNNGLAHLDQAIIDDFDILSFMWDIPRKKSKFPIIANRGNMIGRCTLTDKQILINMESYPVKFPNGEMISPLGKSGRNIKASFSTDGKEAKMSFNTTLGNSVKFCRGIHKIAFSSLTYFLSTAVALNDFFDPVRAFVALGEGKRKVAVCNATDSKYKNEVWPPYVRNEEEYIVHLRIAVAEFFVDLSPNMTMLPDIIEKLKESYGEKGWSYIPV